MTKRKLKRELKRTRKLRDQWCEEYRKARDKALALEVMAEMRLERA